MRSGLTYYPCVFRLEGVDHYVMWYFDDRDGLVREGGHVGTSEMNPAWNFVLER